MSVLNVLNVSSKHTPNVYWSSEEIDNYVLMENEDRNESFISIPTNVEEIQCLPVWFINVVKIAEDENCTHILFSKDGTEYSELFDFRKVIR